MWSSEDKKRLAENINKLSCDKLAVMFNRSQCSMVKQVRKMRKQMRLERPFDDSQDEAEPSPDVQDNVVVARLGWFDIDRELQFCAAEALCLETLRVTLGGLDADSLVTEVRLRAVGLEFSSESLDTEFLSCLIASLRVERLIVMKRGKYHIHGDLRGMHRSVSKARFQDQTVDCGKLYRTPHGVDMSIFDQHESR
jgi:hypothetical protein